MLTSHKIRLFLYLFAAAYFALVAWYQQFILSEELMFFATDSREYREVAMWMLGKGDTVFTQTRPILYPALIGLPYAAGGVYAIWLLQVAGWLLSVDLLFSACYRWTGKYWMAFLAAAFFASNISAVALTFHALTEIVTILGLSLVVWLSARFKNDYGNVRFGNYVLLVLLALTLIKPVFYYPFLLCFLACVVFYYRQYKDRIRNLALPLCALSLLLLQMTLVKVRHGEFTISTISHKTFVEYLFTQGYASFEGLEHSQAWNKVKTMSDEEQSNYFRTHLPVYWERFNQNIDENMLAEPVYLNFTSAYQRVLINTYQFKLYEKLVQPHYWFLIIVCAVLSFSLFARRWNWLIPLVLVGGLLNYYIFATGLSFWQGDRLTLPIIALWPVLYVVLSHDLIAGLVSWFTRRFRKKA